MVEISTILVTCACQGAGLSFEHMFEQSALALEVLCDGQGPIEFTYRGRRFRIHAVLTRWCESGGWWNRIGDGQVRPDDNERAIWRVEAAPIGAINTFELERDEKSGQWLIRHG